jgi:nitrite reductase (NADH) small subunit
MIVVHFDPREANFLLVNGEPFFVLDDGHRPLLVCSDRCPHRGGPLHLGCVDQRTGALTCPWHETTFTRRAIERRSVPTVAVGSRVSAVFNAEAHAEVVTLKRRIIPNEAG